MQTVNMVQIVFYLNAKNQAVLKQLYWTSMNLWTLGKKHI